jgi:hypothetical protein
LQTLQPYLLAGGRARRDFIDDDWLKMRGEMFHDEFGCIGANDRENLKEGSKIEKDKS